MDQESLINYPVALGFISYLKLPLFELAICQPNAAFFFFLKSLMKSLYLCLVNFAKSVSTIKKNLTRKEV